MISWWMVAANALWILGASIALAALSYHRWLAQTSGRTFRETLRERSARIYLSMGAAAFCAGWLLAQADRWWEQALWAFLCGICSWWMIQGFRTPRESVSHGRAASPRPPDAARPAVAPYHPQGPESRIPSPGRSVGDKEPRIPNPESRFPSVSVVIPCRNEVASIGATIEALRNQTRPPEEIVAVDGASTDGTLELLRTLEAESGAGAGVRIRVVVQAGASIPLAVNTGVRSASCDVIVRMDAHSTPAPDYIGRALERLQEPAAGVVGGVWNVAPGAPTAAAAAIARAVSHPLGAGDAAYRIGQHHASATDVETVPFGCFTRATWADLGGLDERLLANEDYEFNHRARERDLRVILDPAIRSTYYARPTLAALARQYFRYGWWKVRMLRKHPGSLRWRQAVPAAFVAGLAVLVLGGALWRPAWWALGGVLAFYVAVLALAAARVCSREGGWSRLLPMVGAFASVHLAWGTGAVLSLLALPFQASRG